MSEKENLVKFLKELANLTQKWGFEIGGCGCCGSPWAYNENLEACHLYYDEKEKTYVAYIGEEEIKGR